MFRSMLSGGQYVLGLLRGQPFVVDAVATIGVNMALGHLHVVHRMGQHQHATRRKHDVVVQDLREAFPQLQRVVVQRRALVEQVVRADDGRVAAGVAAADPALLEHGRTRDAVLRREVIRRRQAMATATDDDGVVLRLRRYTTPLRRPALLTAEGFLEQRPAGKFPHQALRSAFCGSYGESTSTVARLRSPSTSICSSVPTAANSGFT